MISQPQGYVPTAARIAYFVAPITAMAAAFAATTCIATSVRGKDDRLNYVLGAASSAAIYGSWKNSLSTGLHAFIIFGVAAFMKKKSIEEGWVFFPKFKPKRIYSIQINMIILDLKVNKNVTV